MSRTLKLLLPILLITAGGSLMLGLYTGLIRMGIAAPAGLHLNGMLHGPLMINGFLGTLIALERAAALQKLWTYSAPVFLALATFLLLAGQLMAGGFFLIAGSVMLILVLAYLLKLQPEVYHAIMVLAGVSLFIGNFLFISGYPVYELAAWWIAFPVLTIFGERLELNRIMHPPPIALKLFAVMITIWLIMIALLHVDRNIPWQLASVLLILMSVWLIRYDVARKTIKSTGWTRYSAICMLSGYGWLILCGIYGLFIRFPAAGPAYDALLHMVFVGFVFSMIFAHAAIILPALTGFVIPYHYFFYIPFGLLHGFLLVRVTGDLAWLPALKTIGSYGNVTAILLFIAGIVTRLVQGQKQKNLNVKNH